MKKFTLIILAFIVLACTPVQAYNLNRFTDDFKVINALELLKKSGANEVFDNLEQNSVKIMFYDLSMLSYSYRFHYAISGINTFGDRYILLNTRYKKCSTEEIACLIAHESCHTAKTATLAEETRATQTEAKYWLMLKQKDKDYPSNDLYDRLDRLAYLYKNSDENKNRIEERIANSPFYREQLSIK